MKCSKTPVTRAQHGHARNVHVNRVDLRIKALITLEMDDPEDFFFCIMTPHYIPKPWCPARVAQW